MLHYAILCLFMLHNASLYYSMSLYASQCLSIPLHVSLCFPMPLYTSPCLLMLCYASPCCIMLHRVTELTRSSMLVPKIGIDYDTETYCFTSYLSTIKVTTYLPLAYQCFNALIKSLNYNQIQSSLI